MEKVFNPSSWDFKPTSLKIDNKNINLINPQQQNSVNIKQIEMVFLIQIASNNFPGNGRTTPFNSIFKSKEDIL